VILWLVLAMGAFAAILVPVVQAGTGNRLAVLTRHRSLERTLEAHRIARWAAAQPKETLETLPATLTDDLPGEWSARIQAQLNDPASDALTGAEVRLALETDIAGHPELHRVHVELEVPEPAKKSPWRARVTRVVSVR
jgi:hypothetical protein